MELFIKELQLAILLVLMTHKSSVSCAVESAYLISADDGVQPRFSLRNVELFLGCCCRNELVLVFHSIMCAWRLNRPAYFNITLSLWRGAKRRELQNLGLRQAAVLPDLIQKKRANN
jgi:hypothetical protein